MPRHAMLFGPCGNGLVAIKRPTIAGFLMAPKARDTMALVDFAKNRHSIAHPNAERLAKGCKRRCQLGEALRCKVPLPC